MALADNTRFVLDHTFFHDVFHDYKSENSEYSELISDYMLIRQFFDNCKFFIVPEPVRTSLEDELIKRNAALGPILQRSFTSYIESVPTPDMELTNEEWVLFTSSSASSLFPNVYLLSSIRFEKYKKKIEIFFKEKSWKRFKETLGWEVINSKEAWDIIIEKEDPRILRLVINELKKLDKWKDYRF